MLRLRSRCLRRVETVRARQLAADCAGARGAADHRSFLGRDVRSLQGRIAAAGRLHEGSSGCRRRHHQRRPRSRPAGGHPRDAGEVRVGAGGKLDLQRCLRRAPQVRDRSGMAGRHSPHAAGRPRRRHHDPGRLCRHGRYREMVEPAVRGGSLGSLGVAPAAGADRH